jgi:chemotaxis signal transduction protein
MTVTAELDLQSFVLLRLGERRFALAANHIAELVAPSRIFRFPHRTPKVEGVILRRGRMIPVCDVGDILIGKSILSRRFYLLAVRNYGFQRVAEPVHADPESKKEWVAIPVTGECELINAEVTPASESDAPHVAGWLSHNGEVIEVLRMDALTPGPAPAPVRNSVPALVESRP